MILGIDIIGESSRYQISYRHEPVLDPSILVDCFAVGIAFATVRASMRRLLSVRASEEWKMGLAEIIRPELDLDNANVERIMLLSPPQLSIKY